MKNLIYFYLFTFFLHSAGNAQVVDQSINGIQAGFFGVWVHNESKIARHWAFRSEIGYEAPYTSDLVSEIFLPVIAFEPRWYYNSPKRQGNSKNWFHNSSNFAAVSVRCYPEFLALSFYDETRIDGGIFITPTWGIRRNINYRLNYELGIGGGVDVYELVKDIDHTTDFFYNLHIRIGYKFGKGI